MSKGSEVQKLMGSQVSVLSTDLEGSFSSSIVFTKPMVASVVFHLALISLMMFATFSKSKEAALTPPVNVDLVDIEFTATDQDLSKVKPLGSTQPNIQSSVKEKTPQPEVVKRETETLKKEIVQNTEVTNTKKAIESIAPQNLNTLPQTANTDGGSSGFQGSSEGTLQKLKMSYDQYLLSYINRYKTYPRIAERLKQQGVVDSKIIISKDGKLKDVIINKSSGFSSLDQGTINLIKSLAPFKPLPEHLDGEYEVNIPIEYILAHGS